VNLPAPATMTSSHWRALMRHLPEIAGRTRFAGWYLCSEHLY